jgi:spermidine/putrescine transport system permease protein
MRALEDFGLDIASKRSRMTKEFPMLSKIHWNGLKCWTWGVLTFLYFPIFVLVAYSFNDSKLNVIWKGFTFQWYRDLWFHEPLMKSAQNSLWIASVTTVCSLILGVGSAWYFHRYRSPFQKGLKKMMMIPLALPEILLGIGLLVLFAVVQIPLGFTTVIIAHITFCLPFVIVTVLARLSGMDPSLEEAALDLGATPIRAFFSVILPYLTPAVISSGLIAFTLSLDDFIVTYFTTGPQSQTLPIRIFGMTKVGLNPVINALSTIFILVTVIALFFAFWKKRTP